MTEDFGVISSLIVKGKPEHLDAIASRISDINGAEIAVTDPCGKMVVVLEAESDRDLADTMKLIGEFPEVLSVNMVFHHSEAAN